MQGSCGFKYQKLTQAGVNTENLWGAHWGSARTPGQLGLVSVWNQGLNSPGKALQHFCPLSVLRLALLLPSALAHLPHAAQVEHSLHTSSLLLVIAPAS